MNDHKIFARLDGETILRRSARDEKRLRELGGSARDSAPSPPYPRRYALGANFAFSALITFGGAKAEASPPIEAICRTKVAVIGLTGEDAGRYTVRNSGAIAPFMPAIYIS